ncbi:hypothetical protein L1987_87140 [Smallanthus sonchifolius]|nr:hypothetical protein L1987_87140 [Smallanthus sonchifolius]
MAFSHIHLITSLLLVFIPYVASLQFNFTNINTSNQNRDIVSEGEGSYISNEGIQVTPNEIGSVRTEKAGRAKYIRLLHLWDKGSGERASFSTNFTFVIDSIGDTEYADGLTFFLAQNNSLITTGGAMGLPVNLTTMVATSQFVAVEFDTFPNTWDPKVWNATVGENVSIGDHVGISISSLASVKSTKWLSNITGGAVCQAWITYDSVSNNLSVSFTGFDQNNTVVRQDGLVYTVDLKKELPEWVIFGFSAATGDWFEKNNVRSWSFDSSDLKIDSKSVEPVKEKTSNVGLIVGLSITVTIIVLSALAFVLWMWQNTVREHEAYENSSDQEMDNEFEEGTGPKRFSYHELAQSTSDFAEEEKLGEGACGKKSIENKGQEEPIQLVKWVWKHYETKTLLEAVDPSLGSDFEEEEIKCLMILGLWCAYPNSIWEKSLKY